MRYADIVNKIMQNIKGHYVWLTFDIPMLINKVNDYFRRIVKLQAIRIIPVDFTPFRMDFCWLRTRSFCVRNNYHRLQTNED